MVLRAANRDHRVPPNAGFVAPVATAPTGRSTRSRSDLMLGSWRHPAFASDHAHFRAGDRAHPCRSGAGRWPNGGREYWAAPTASRVCDVAGSVSRRLSKRSLSWGCLPSFARPRGSPRRRRPCQAPESPVQTSRSRPCQTADRARRCRFMSGRRPRAVQWLRRREGGRLR